jgi:hypothetical protein
LWFSYHRLLEPIGYVPPVEYEEAYYRAQEAWTSEPVLNFPSLRKSRAIQSVRPPFYLLMNADPQKSKRDQRTDLNA